MYRGGRRLGIGSGTRPVAQRDKCGYNPCPSKAPERHCLTIAPTISRELARMTIANTPSWSSEEGAERVYLASAFLQVEYDLGRGRVSLFTASSRPLVLSATAGVALRQGVALASDPRYTRGSRIVTLTEPPLAGLQLRVQCHDTHRHIDLEQRITLLHDRSGAIVKIILNNVS